MSFLIRTGFQFEIGWVVKVVWKPNENWDSKLVWHLYRCCNISELLTFVESGLGPDKIRPNLIVAAVPGSGRRVRLVVVLWAHNSSSFDCFPLLLFILAPLLLCLAREWDNSCAFWKSFKNWDDLASVLFCTFTFSRCEWFLHLLLILAAALSLGRGSAQQLDLVEFINAQFYGHGQGYIIYRSFDIF